jgi:hypothetical protein
MWNITKHQRLDQIVLESGAPREMTKREKKLKRRGTSVTVGLVYSAARTADGDGTEDA